MIRISKKHLNQQNFKKLLVFLMLFLVAACTNTINAGTIADLTRPYIIALQKSDTSSARSLYSTETIKRLSEAELVNGLDVLIKAEPIQKYQNLQICEFGLISQDGSQLAVGLGLITYSGGRSRFSATIRLDEDKKWRLAGFQLQRQMDNKPWGACA